MSDKTYRLRDIPKGERLAHFLHYYKLQTFLAVVLVIIVGYTVYGFFQPRPDLQVMWLSGDYDLDCEFELRENLEAMDWDTNGDGTVRVLLTYVDFDRDYQELSYETRSELVTLVAGQDYSFFLANGFARDWMAEHDILAAWGDIGAEGPGAEAPLAVPVSRIGALAGDHAQPLEDLFLCVKSPPEDGDEGRLAEYRTQAAALARLLEREGLTPPAESEVH